MDSLERYIKENKDKFEIYEPSPKVWRMIREDIAPEKRKFRLITMISKVAAVMVVVLFAGMGSGYLLGNWQHQSTNKTSSLDELKRAESYFGKEVSYRIDEINKLNVNNNDISNDLKQLEDVYFELREQLIKVPDSNNDRVIQEMIDNYRIRISLLEKILEKTKSNENTIKNEENISI